MIDRDKIYSNFIPSEVIPGITDFEVFYSIENIGAAVVGSFDESFYLSSDRIQILGLEKLFLCH